MPTAPRNDLNSSFSALNGVTWFPNRLRGRPAAGELARDHGRALSALGSPLTLLTRPSSYAALAGAE